MNCSTNLEYLKLQISAKLCVTYFEKLMFEDAVQDYGESLLLNIIKNLYLYLQTKRSVYSEY